MASALYSKAKYLVATGSLDWTAGNFSACIVDLADYTFDKTHDYLTSVDAAARVSTTALTGRAITETDNGAVFSADNATFAEVSGHSIEAVIIYHDTGVEATSELFAYIDDAVGLPFTPDGSDVALIFDPVNGIFTL